MTPFAIIVRAHGGGWQVLALFPDGHRRSQWCEYRRTARLIVAREMGVSL